MGIPYKYSLRALSFLLLVFFATALRAQQRRIDSLEKLAARPSHDSVKLRLYHDICVICETKDNLKYGRIYDSLADRLIARVKNQKERERYIRQKIDAYNVIGIYYEELEQIDSLEKYNIRRIELAKTSQNTSLLNEQVDNLARMYSRENAYTKVMNLYTDELKNAEKANNEKQVIYALRAISETYGQMRNNKKSLEYSLKVLELEKNNITDSTTLAYAYFNVGQKYYSLYNYDKAIYYYLKSYTILEKKINNRDKSFYLFHLARAYNEQKNSAEARKYLLKALDIVKGLGDPVIVGVVHSEIGQTYFYENNIEKALEYKLQAISLINNKSDGDAFLPYFTTGQVYLKINEYKLAEKYVLKAKKIAEDRSHIHNQRTAMKLLADIYSAKGDVTKSNAYLVKYYQLNDSINALKNAEELLYKELNYENDKQEASLKAEQEKQNTIHQEEKEKQRVLLVSVLAFLLLVAVFSIFMYRRFKITQKQKLIIEQKEIETQKQKRLIEEKQKEIIDSITYASRIQKALITNETYIARQLDRLNNN